MSLIPVAQPVQQQPLQQARDCLQDSQRIFCDPQPYIMGAAVGATVALFTGITNPFAGAFMGAPFLPIVHFVDQHLAYLGNTLTLRIARWSLSFFISASIGTIVAALCGFQITLAHGALLVLALVVSAVAFVSHGMS